MAITAHPYSDAQRGRLRAFMMEQQAQGAPGVWHTGDLAWGLFLMSIRCDLAEVVRLWQDEQGEVAGFAWFNPSDCFLLMQVQPGGHSATVSDAMLAWGRACRAETASRRPAGDPAPPLFTSAFESDVDRQASLARLGLTRGARSMVVFRRALAQDVPPPRLPAGFTVRAMAGEAEVSQRAGAHREAFTPSRLTDEQYHRLRLQPDYAADLDLVTVAADGTVATFCQCWLDPVNKVGLFEPVGARAAFRRQGLTQAVLLEGLRRMQAQGMQSALVCTNLTNLAAQALYQSVGFGVDTYDIDFTLA